MRKYIKPIVENTLAKQMIRSRMPTSDGEKGIVRYEKNVKPR